MRISNLRLERGPESARVVAAVQWEDCARAPLELFFETDSRGARDLSPEPEAFLTACALPAMREGERRILLEGPICPRLSAGITAAIALVRSWYGPPRKPVAIEATRGLREIPPRRPERSAFFFTAGVDSTHLLQSNRAFYPADHPDAFADCLSAFGHLCPTDDRSRSWNESAGRNIAAAAREEGLGFLPIRNNVWDLAPDVEFLAAESLASAIASSAHLFRRRWSTIAFASGRDSARQPCGARIRCSTRSTAAAPSRSGTARALHAFRAARGNRLLGAAAAKPGRLPGVSGPAQPELRRVREVCAHDDGAPGDWKTRRGVSIPGAGRSRREHSRGPDRRARRRLLDRLPAAARLARPTGPRLRHRRQARGRPPAETLVRRSGLEGAPAPVGSPVSRRRVGRAPASRVAPVSRPPIALDSQRRSRGGEDRGRGAPPWR